MQIIEAPYMKMISLTVNISNTDNTIILSNYSAHYWTLTAALPQSTIHTDTYNYTLDKLIVIRRE